MSSIALACNFKNEVENVRRIFNCVESVISEIVVVDCGSTDGTRELCKKLGARVYDIGECPGYGQMRTITLHLCRTEWALILDGDEMMDPPDVHKIPELTTRLQDSEFDVIQLPRQHFRSWDRSICENPDLSQYADWQNRLVRVNQKIHWIRRVHEQIRGIRKEYRDLSNPVIRHFGFMKTPERLQEIVDLCNRLWKQDQENEDTYELEKLVGEASGPRYWKESPHYHEHKTG